MSKLLVVSEDVEFIEQVRSLEAYEVTVAATEQEILDLSQPLLWDTIILLMSVSPYRFSIKWQSPLTSFSS